MKQIYVTATYGMTIDVSDDATDDEIESLAQGALLNMSSDFMTDWDWEHLEN